MGRRYITLDQTSDSVSGLYSKLSDIEEPGPHLQTSNMMMPLASAKAGRPGHSCDNLQQLQAAEDDSPKEEAVLLSRQADLQDQTQHAQPAAQQGQHQLSQQRRQPFKQLQSSQPQQQRQQQQQLEMQHLSSDKSHAPTDIVFDNGHNKEPTLFKQHQQQGITGNASSGVSLSDTQEARVRQFIGSIKPQQQDAEKRATLVSSHQQQQQLQQQYDVTSPFASTQDLHTATDCQQRTADRWTLLFESLSPRRLWAFLALGIPGGLASSVESSAAEVTTALAGILGKPCTHLPAVPAEHIQKLVCLLLGIVCGDLRYENNNSPG